MIARLRQVGTAVLIAAIGLATGVQATLPGPGGDADAGDMAPAPRAVRAALNIPPVATPDFATVTAGSVLAVPAPGVLSNDTDVEGGPLTAQLKTPAIKGKVVLSADGSYVYTAPMTAVTDHFSYVAVDPLGTSNTASVVITVLPLPLPSLTPLPTLPPLPSLTPLPTILPTPSLSLPPRATPTPDPDASPTPTPDPDVSPSAPSPSSRPGPVSPGGSGAGTGDPGASVEREPPPTGPEIALVAYGPDPARSISGVGAAGASMVPLEWAVPAAALAFPGLLVILVATAQTVGGAAWIPVVRRALRGTGYTREPRRYRYIGPADR